MHNYFISKNSNKTSKPKGKVRVGRTIYTKGGRKDPVFQGFTNIIVLMKSHSQWGVISPYDLKDEKERFMENIWQFSKVYQNVPKTTQKYSRYNQTVIWQHSAENHVDKDRKLTRQYFAWRKKGMNNKYAVRYPVGFQHRHKCLYALSENPDGTVNPEKLDYVQSRKAIYVKHYCRLVKKHPKFLELQKRLNKGENLLIIEVDGPHQESLDYYKNMYAVGDDFIQNSTMLANQTNIGIMLNDEKHPFGHGYCLAMALLDIFPELYN